MTKPYGPWATAINTGRNPQLSSFWRQRLTMLVPASQTSPVLSRRNLLGLIAAAGLVYALPTFLAAPAVAEQEKVSNDKSKEQGIDAGTKKSSATQRATMSSTSSTFTLNSSSGSGTVTISSGGRLFPEPMMGPSQPNDLAFPFYKPLLNARTRAELQLSSQQEQKLHELNRKYLAEFRPNERKLIQELNKATANSPPEEQNRKMMEMWTKIRRAARPLRLQVEALLTPAQLARLRMLALVDRISPAFVLCHQFYDAQVYARLTEAEKQEIERLYRRESEFQQKAYERIVQRMRKRRKGDRHPHSGAARTA